MARRLILKEDYLNTSSNPSSGYKFIGYDGLTFSERQSDGDVVPIGGSNTNTNEWTYDLGQYVSDEGGVVFHRYKDGGVQNYLICDTDDLTEPEQGITWSSVTAAQIGSSAMSFWDGESNSNAIVNQSLHSYSAADLCLSSTRGGHGDWYLPSIDELGLLWHNRFNLNRTLSGSSSYGVISGVTGFTTSNTLNYWSSTEINSTQARYFVFNGDQNGVGRFGNKTTSTYKVRAIRKISL